MNYLIVAHDAGGAEIVSAWVKVNPQYQYLFLLEGPAVSVFSRKIPQLTNVAREELPRLLSKIDFVLTGTSWGSDLERQIIQVARSNGVPVASYLDHWNNYLERFLCQSTLCLPNEIWVGDKEAEILAKNIFKNMPVILVKNQYFNEIKCEFEKIDKPPRSDKSNLLYICEPISACNTWKIGNKDHQKYTEFTALDYFFQNLFLLDLYKHLNCIKIRLHPSEPKGKYNDILEDILPRSGCEIVYSENTSLFEDFAWSDLIVGISSMALVIASMLEKKVFSCAPENAVVMKLPLKGILQFDKNSIQDKRIAK